MAINLGTAGKDGQPCTVTSGPNAGKHGTYTTDDDGSLWCEGDWGGTECDGDKCKDGARQTTVLDYVDASGQPVYEVEGDFTDSRGGPIRVKVKLDAVSLAKLTASAEPVDAPSFDGLDLGDAKLTQAVRRAVGDNG